MKCSVSFTQIHQDSNLPEKFNFRLISPQIIFPEVFGYFQTDGCQWFSSSAVLFSDWSDFIDLKPLNVTNMKKKIRKGANTFLMWCNSGAARSRDTVVMVDDFKYVGSTIQSSWQYRREVKKCRQGDFWQKERSNSKWEHLQDLLWCMVWRHWC